MREGRVVAVLQARMSSTRLPGKVLKPILGLPMLARQLERLRRCAALDELVVATSDRPDDDPVADLCAVEGVACFRGSLNDVLDRFYQCAKAHGADHVVRLTGDCPLSDPRMVDELVRFYLERDLDYAANCRPPTLPDGLDAEVFTFAALEAAWREADEPFAREHVVPFIIRRPERFRMGNWAWPEDLSGLRWTVDEPEDLAFVTLVYEALYPDKPDFGFQDVLDLLQRRPELADLNRRFERNEGSRRT
jgi:spore coat polysaccharide biosynthesis protein SpsF (cytidylyltransferase family)